MPGPGGPGGPGGGMRGPGGSAPPPRRSGGSMMGGMGCGGSMIAVLVIGLCLMASACAAFTTSENYIWTLVFVGVLIAMVVILIVLKKRQEAREKETEATERMLKTPLEKYGDEPDEEVAELERKYAGSSGTGDAPAAAPQSASQAPSAPSAAAYCPSCGAKVISEDQAFCTSCGAALPRDGSAAASPHVDSAAQSADSSTN